MSTGATVQEPLHKGGADRIWAFRDILRAVALSFDREKLLTGGVGLFLSAFVFGTLHWLGLLTGKDGAVRVFSVLGAILASCVWVVFSGVIARMSLTQLLEDRKAGTEEIRRFLRERWTTLVGTPAAFAALSLALLAGMAVIEAMGAIPGIGPILFGALFLAAFVLAFTAALFALVHGLGTFLYPSIVASRRGGAVSVLSELVDLVRRKGIVLLFYEAVAGLVGLLMTVIIGAIAWAGLYIVHWSAAPIMKDNFHLSLTGIPRFFRIFLRPFEAWLPLMPVPAEVAWHYDVAGFLLGFSLLWIVIATALYPFVFFNTAGSITYLILREEKAEPTGPID